MHWVEDEKEKIDIMAHQKMNGKLYQKVFLAPLEEPEVGLVDLLEDVEGQAATVLRHGSYIMRLGRLGTGAHFIIKQFQLWIT